MNDLTGIISLFRAFSNLHDELDHREFEPWSFVFVEKFNFTESYSQNIIDKFYLRE